MQSEWFALVGRTVRSRLSWWGRLYAWFTLVEPAAIDEYRRSEGHTTEKIVWPTNATLRRIWMLFEFPETSRVAFVVAVWSVLMTLLSIILFCIETLPTFAMTHCEEGELPNFLDAFFLGETLCTAWFTVEVVLRFVSCPSKLGFWRDFKNASQRRRLSRRDGCACSATGARARDHPPTALESWPGRDFKNIVDVVAIVPYYVTLFNVLSTMSCTGAKSSASLAFLRVIRLIRVFKLTKHSVGLQVLLLTFRASLEGLG